MKTTAIPARVIDLEEKFGYIHDPKVWLTLHFMQSPYIADNIVLAINEAVSTYQHNPEALKNELEKIAREQGSYLSPTLRVEMELLIAKAEAKQAVAK